MIKTYLLKDKYITEWNNIKLNIVSWGKGYSIHHYKVELIEGNWPTDSELICICDGTDPSRPRNFGGFVKKYVDETAFVDVYVD